MNATNENLSDRPLLFAEETPPTIVVTGDGTWKVLIVDDDDQVHLVTRMVLGNLIIAGRRTQFLSAYSAVEAKGLFAQHDDIAVMLLDVVMESDDSGLQLARYLREDLKNESIRIIMRTGQPGLAPERHIIDHYDINDYRSKSELTAEKLYTAVATALRSYRDIYALDQRRRGFQRIIAASAALYNKRSLSDFVTALSSEFCSLIPGIHGLLLCAEGPDGLSVIGGGGVFANRSGQLLPSCLTEAPRREIERVLRGQESLFAQDHCVIRLPSRTGAHRVAYMTGDIRANMIDRCLLDLFCTKAATAFDNVYLNEQVLAAQRATVYALGRLAEYKDQGGAETVLRIGHLARRIAQRLKDSGAYPDEIDDQFFERIELASVLHDVGKVAVPDSILQKAGSLDAHENACMERHVAVGAALLREAAAMVDRPTYLCMGAEIAQHHHERFDGSGYPQGLSGSDIPLSAQIVAIADVFDALIRHRHYKEASTPAEALDWIRGKSGQLFAPEVAEAFLAVVDEQDFGSWV